MRLRPLALSLSLALPALAQAQPFEASFLAFPTGTEATSRYNVNVAAADFDGDGLPDLAVARNVFAGGFTLLRNTGDGTYAAPVHYGPVSTGGGPVPLPGQGLRGSFDLEPGDFDEDGDLDVVATTAESSNIGTVVSLYRNDGGGVFVAAEPTTVGPGGPFEVDAADFNGDSHLDLAVTRYDVAGSAAVSVLMGTGTGAFGAPAATYPLFDERGEAVVEAGDLDGDGDADFAVGTPGDARLAVFLNDGAGAFVMTTVTAPAPAQSVQSLALADADNDGDLDVLAASGYDQGLNAGLLTVFRNAGAGAFEATVEPFSDTPNAYIANAWDLVADDFDGDGNVDVVGVTYQNTIGGLVVLLGDGAAGFAPARRAPSLETAVAVASTDYDADGDPDIVTVDRLEFLVAVHENRGGLDLFTPPSFTVEYATAVALGDLDGDGDLDAATTGEGANASPRTTLLRNDGAGAFVAVAEFGAGVLDARLRDLNGDGRADLVAGFGGDAVVALSAADGTVGDTTLVQMAPCLQRGMVDAVDLDNDGDRDLVLNETFGCTSGGTVNVWTALNDGDGTFAAAVASRIEPLDSGNLPVEFDRFATGDFNGDGFADLALPDYTTVVALGNGDGTFGTLVELPAEERPWFVEAVDVDADGDLDLAMAGGFGGFAGPSEALIRLGDGAGAFASPQAVTVGPRVSGLTAGDADLDGDADLLVSVGDANGAVFLENDGAGAFTVPFTVGVAWLFTGGEYADVTGDGLGDLVGLYSLPPGGFGTAFLVLVRGVDLRQSDGEPGAPSPPEALAAPLALSAAAPNPAAGSAAFSLTSAEGQRVVVEAFDALGRRVATLFDGPVEAGTVTRVVFSGAGLPDGVYFVRATGEHVAATRRVTLLR